MLNKSNIYSGVLRWLCSTPLYSDREKNEIRVLYMGENPLSIEACEKWLCQLIYGPLVRGICCHLSIPKLYRMLFNRYVFYSAHNMCIYTSQLSLGQIYSLKTRLLRICSTYKLPQCVVYQSITNKHHVRPAPPSSVNHKHAHLYSYSLVPCLPYLFRFCQLHPAAPQIIAPYFKILIFTCYSHYIKKSSSLNLRHMNSFRSTHMTICGIGLLIVMP